MKGKFLAGMIPAMVSAAAFALGGCATSGMPSATAEQTTVTPSVSASPATAAPVAAPGHEAGPMDPDAIIETE
jgi:hypothetical protein